MRGIAHQRKPRLHILQRMSARQRKRTSGKRCNVTQTRREMLRDFRLELRHFIFCNWRIRTESHTTPAIPSYQTTAETPRSVRGKLLPGAVAGIVSHCTLINIHDCAILPGMNANSRHLPHLRICAVSTNHQLRANHFTALQFQLLKSLSRCNAISEPGTRNVLSDELPAPATMPVAGRFSTI